jgi:hypothetical protein
MTDGNKKDNVFSDEEYDHWLIQQYFELNLDEEEYSNNPTDFLLLQIYLKYRASQLPPADALLKDLDNYLERRLKYEFSRRKKGGHQITISDFSAIVNDKNPAAKKKEYAKKHGISLNSVEKRLQAFRKYWSSLMLKVKSRGNRNG